MALPGCTARTASLVDVQPLVRIGLGRRKGRPVLTTTLTLTQTLALAHTLTPALALTLVPALALTRPLALPLARQPRGLAAGVRGAARPAARQGTAGPRLRAYPFPYPCPYPTPTPTLPLTLSLPYP